MEFAGRKLHVIDDTCVRRFARLGKKKKKKEKKKLVSSCLSVRKEHSYHWTDFHEI